MWWFLANLDFWQWLWVVVHGLLVVVGWLFLVGNGGCWVVVGGCSWLAVLVDRFVVFLL